MLIGIDASRATSSSPTGTENYSREVIRALLSQDPQNRFVLYTRESVPEGFFGATANYQVRPITFPRLWTHIRLSLEILAHPPDLLFVPAHVLPPILPGRSIVTIHDLGHLHYPDAHPAAQLAYHQWTTRWNATRASHILADSDATRDDIVRFCGVTSDKVSVVYPAYDSLTFRPVKDTDLISRARARFRIGMDYIISIGTVHPRKNYARLIHAFAKMDAHNCVLAIAGKKGWHDEEILSLAQSLGIGDRVKFLGYVEQEYMPALLSGAMIFAFPSLHEGFGLPILEAQACGVPIVCSMTSSLPEAAGDGALFVDPCDVDALAASMDRLIVDHALRTKLTENGFRNINRFSWEKSARQIQELIDRIR